MKRPQRLIQAYRQAPWRTHQRWVGFFVFVTIFTAVVAVVYLSISGRASAYGLDIQQFKYLIGQKEILIADLEAELASMTTIDKLMERAEAMDYVRVQPGQVHYIVVPGYSGRPPVSLAPPAQLPAQSQVPPEYEQSLLDWLGGFLLPSGQQPTEVGP